MFEGLIAPWEISNRGMRVLREIIRSGSAQRHHGSMLRVLLMENKWTSQACSLDGDLA